MKDKKRAKPQPNRPSAATQPAPKPTQKRTPAYDFNRLSAWLPVGIVAVAFVAVFVCLVVFENDFLWKAQEMNLFLDTPLFFSQQMVVPGGLLTWAGCWFTEYFFHPWVGVLWLLAWWALLMLLTWRTFRVPRRWMVVLLVPVALLLVTVVDMGYWLYYLKLRGHIFSATIGMTCAVAAVWLYRVLPSRWALRPCYVALAAVLLYPLMGFYALLALLLMALLSWRLPDMKGGQRLLSTLVAVLAGVAVPLFYYRYHFCQTNITDIYTVALPLYKIANEWDATLYTPFVLLVVCYILLALGYGRKADCRPLWWSVGQAVLCLGLVAGVGLSWMRDYNFHTELRMQRCMEQEDWQGILDEAAHPQEPPTRAIIMMRNLALFRLGRQGNEMYHYLTGAEESKAGFTVHMTQIVGRSIYYNYGLLNYCYRWCLEDGVEFGWRAEFLKYLTRCALVNGEWQVARKYLRLLEHTRYHRRWAQQQERFLGHEKLLRADASYSPVFHLLSPKDILSSDNELVEQFLMYHFVNTPGDDPLYREQRLLSALWSKDIGAFWSCFFPYAEQHPNNRMPTHFQEAAYLYGHLEPDRVDISRMPFDPQVRQTYDSFMRDAMQYVKGGEEYMRQMLYPMYGHTFYYEYYLVRGQKLY